MIAAVLAHAGFAIACIAGLAAGADPVGVLWNALGAMAACLLVGLGLGLVADAVVREYVRAYRDAHPLGRAPRRGTPPPGEAAQPSHAAQPS
jgi:hypothetical protein